MSRKPRKKSWPEKYPSPVPKQVFSRILAEQEKQLESNEVMLRFAKSRSMLASDPYRPAYHFVSPESQLNDPNGLCFWRGRWHLFYQGYPPDEFPEPGDIPKRRQHWGHAVSDDLVHWRDLPYAIYPGIERMCFSGGTAVEANRVVAFYPGIDAGQMLAVARDPLLLNWEKIEGNPVTRPGEPMGDSCIWKESGAYFGLVGARCLLESKNLVDWEVRNGNFLAGPSFPIDDGSCPTFLPIADKHILLLFSHARGGQYLLGDYDRRKHQFTPYDHGRFNHGNVAPGGVHAPSGAVDGKGGVVNILNINDGKDSDDWNQIMSLAQRLTLGPDKRLRIEPVAANAALRGKHRRVGRTVMPANEEIVLDAIGGNSMELAAEIDPRGARWVQLNVLRSPTAEERTSITFYNYDCVLSNWYHTRGAICLDGSRSSVLPDVWLRPPENAAVERGNGPPGWFPRGNARAATGARSSRSSDPEGSRCAKNMVRSLPSSCVPSLMLRVFIDRSVVEVFVNGQQYLAMRVYPGRKDSVGVSVRAHGRDAVLKGLDSWQMQSIWPQSA